MTMRIYHVTSALLLILIVYTFWRDADIKLPEFHTKEEIMENVIQMDSTQTEFLKAINAKTDRLQQDLLKIKSENQLLKSRYAKYDAELARYEDSLTVSFARYHAFGQSVNDYVNTQMDFNVNVDSTLFKQLWMQPK